MEAQFDSLEARMEELFRTVQDSLQRLNSRIDSLENRRAMRIDKGSPRYRDSPNFGTPMRNTAEQWGNLDLQSKPSNLEKTIPNEEEDVSNSATDTTHLNRDGDVEDDVSQSKKGEEQGFLESAIAEIGLGSGTSPLPLLAAVLPLDRKDERRTLEVDGKAANDEAERREAAAVSGFSQTNGVQPGFLLTVGGFAAAQPWESIVAASGLWEEGEETTITAVLIFLGWCGSAKVTKAQIFGLIVGPSSCKFFGLIKTSLNHGPTQFSWILKNGLKFYQWNPGGPFRLFLGSGRRRAEYLSKFPP
ncbi:hypothetical protein PIB30_052352 [Stylosanthes scabra]|uniref:Uncharacterized protein n=1 Tax=Stylosanthes scabra TaxID=79078 RepID=A0ABU6RIC0_9FABA|nr:hypothetical protein [Stylosanthes scabra]